MITIALESPREPDSIEMLDRSCAYIRDLYPADRHHTYHLDELEDDGLFFLMRHERQIIGCGAIVRRSWNEVEFKHIFIDEAVRGLGFGRTLLAHMEAETLYRGVQRMILETGNKQPAAYGLYKRCGYRECLPYVAKPLRHAIFMEKFLPPRP